MKDQLKAYLISACRSVLTPLIKILIRAGISHKEFSETAKRVYVAMARDDYGVQGRKTNMARVAILTGLSRKECLRVRRLNENGGKGQVEFVPNPAARVVTAWASDPDFAQEGSPMILPLSGPHPSVDSLFERFAGDIPQGALLKELLRVGAVEQRQSKLLLKRRTFIPPGFDQDRIRILATQLSDLGSTIYYNLVSDGSRRMQRYVVNDGPLSKGDIGRFQSLATAQGQTLLEELDQFLTKSTSTVADAPPSQRVGVGIYFFEEPVSPGGDL
ncbi:MAG: DUF6502 family protein [Pseudomonadota bacterium]